MKKKYLYFSAVTAFLLAACSGGGGESQVEVSGQSYFTYENQRSITGKAYIEETSPYTYDNMPFEQSVQVQSLGLLSPYCPISSVSGLPTGQLDFDNYMEVDFAATFSSDCQSNMIYLTGEKRTVTTYSNGQTQNDIIPFSYPINEQGSSGNTGYANMGYSLAYTTESGLIYSTTPSTTAAETISNDAQTITVGLQLTNPNSAYGVANVPISFITPYSNDVSVSPLSGYGDWQTDAGGFVFFNLTFNENTSNDATNYGFSAVAMDAYANFIITQDGRPENLYEIEALNDWDEATQAIFTNNEITYSYKLTSTDSGESVSGQYVDFIWTNPSDTTIHSISINGKMFNMSDSQKSYTTQTDLNGIVSFTIKLLDLSTNDNLDTDLVYQFLVMSHDASINSSFTISPPDEDSSGSATTSVSSSSSSSSTSTTSSSSSSTEESCVESPFGQICSSSSTSSSSSSEELLTPPTIPES